MVNRIDEGHCGDVDLSRVTAPAITDWPKGLHDGRGKLVYDFGSTKRATSALIFSALSTEVERLQRTSGPYRAEAESVSPAERSRLGEQYRRSEPLSLPRFDSTWSVSADDNEPLRAVQDAACHAPHTDVGCVNRPPDEPTAEAPPAEKATYNNATEGETDPAARAPDARSPRYVFLLRPARTAPSRRWRGDGQGRWGKDWGKRWGFPGAD